MRYTYEHEGRRYSLLIEGQGDGRFSVSLGDNTTEIEAMPLANGGWRLLFDGQAYTVYSGAQGDARYVQVDDTSYSLRVPVSNQRRKAPSGRDMLTAQMPGQVTAVLVQDGEGVERGQTLLILEAMKMEIRVTAPADGYLKGVLVKVGDVVERGQQLVSFERVPA